MASPKFQHVPFSLLLLLFFFLFVSLSYGEGETPSNLIRLSCVHARYPTLCIHTLSSVASSAKTPNDLALAALSVSMHRARKVSAFASRFVKVPLPKANKREKSALRDCVEQLSDSVDQLVRTMSELRHLRSGTFRWQMSNAETWVSAALTNEDSCLDGFEGVDGTVKKAVRRKIFNVARVTSNALYFINRLALVP